ncbi:MAG: hypothetical protein KIT68_11245 [Phycisphaeraceae bacterium]|nr:hypothetical protein [Phycisphaeraceae bacterium]
MLREVGGDAGRGLVEGEADLVDVGGFAGGVGVAAELGDGGVGVVRGPDDAGADGGAFEAVDALAEVHLEGLHGDAEGAVGQAGVELVLQGDERLDLSEAVGTEGLGEVVDADGGGDAGADEVGRGVGELGRAGGAGGVVDLARGGAEDLGAIGRGAGRGAGRGGGVAGRADDERVEGAAARVHENVLEAGSTGSTRTAAARAARVGTGGEAGVLSRPEADDEIVAVDVGEQGRRRGASKATGAAPDGRNGGARCGALRLISRQRQQPHRAAEGSPP